MLVPLLLAAGVIGLVISTRSKGVGNQARVGDDVLIPLPGLPPGESEDTLDSAVMTVEAADSESLTGIIFAKLVSHPQPMGPELQILRNPIPNVSVDRSAVRSVSREGRVIAE